METNKHNIYNKEFRINSKIYKVRYSSAFKDNHVIELVSIEDNSDVLFSVTGFSENDAIMQLNFILSDHKIEPEKEITLIKYSELSSKEQKKITTKLKSIKSELMGEWHSYDTLYQDWSFIAKGAQVKIRSEYVPLRRIVPYMITLGTFKTL